MPKLVAPVKHLLVDLDGTLLHNREFPLAIDFVFKSISTLKKKLGLRKATRTLMEIRKVFEKPSSEKTNDIRVLEILSQSLELSLDESRNFLRESLFKIFPTLEGHFYPVPGSKQFLQWAHENGYPMTLATNPVWPIEVIEMRVRWAGVDPKLFQFVTYANRMKACKPELQYYEEILSLQNLKAADCLLIGNEVKMDLPAVKAGIRVFIVGDFKKLVELHPKGARAPAFRGTYPHLKSLLSKAPT